ncbi:MAG: rod shape-determining protein MreC [Actinobacteria bacterium]|nr:rod shape-determining protein MreC [Actinomycetota bacterium]
MAPPRRSRRSRFTLLLLVLASLTVLTLDYRDTAPVRGLRSVAATVFSPVRSLADTVGGPVGNVWNGITRYDGVRAENRRLRQRIDQLQGDRIRSEVDARELRQLRRQADIPFVGDLPKVVAQVVSGPVTSFDQTFEIDRGTGDGLRKDMPVVTDAGLVGRVVRVTGDRAAIQLVTDSRFRFGVRLTRSGEVGIARGGRDGRLVVDEGVSADTDVKKGDTVTTSGVDGSVFPPKVPVGTVVSVRRTDDRTEKVLEIQPVANLDGLTYVTVLLCDGTCR